MEAIIFIGIQASGKSQFYKERFIDSHIRINLDMLRTRNREKIFIQACIETKQSFVIDNTNPGVQDRAKYFNLLKDEDFKIKGYYFSSKLNDSIKRNIMRSKPVPEIGIRGTYNKLVLPGLEEGFDELYYVKIENNTFEVSPWNNEI